MNYEAILNVEKGEEIAMMCVSQFVVGSGHFKFLVKKKKDRKFEWAHFVERADKKKENVYRGEAVDLEQLKLVLDIMKRNLIKEAEGSIKYFIELKSGSVYIFLI